MRLIFTIVVMSWMGNLFWMCTPKKTTRQIISPSQKHILTDFKIPELNRSKTIRLYLPPNYANEETRFPVVYMHDAQNLFEDSTSYVGEWQVDEKLDSLFSTTGLRFIVVGIDHGNEKRIQELSTYENPKYGKAEGDAYLKFITETLKPVIDRDYRTLPERENTYMMGSSLGGLMTHSALLKAHSSFGKFGVLSPSYWFAGKEIYTDTQKTNFPKTTKAYILVGAQEGDSMEPDAEKMYAILEQKLPKNQIHYYADPSGKHNEAFWRKHFAAILVWLWEK